MRFSICKSTSAPCGASTRVTDTTNLCSVEAALSCLRIASVNAFKSTGLSASGRQLSMTCDSLLEVTGASPVAIAELTSYAAIYNIVSAEPAGRAECEVQQAYI